MVAGQVTVEETGCRLAVTSDSASATIEPTVVVRPDATVEEIGRRLAAMLAEKGILINSPQCVLTGRRRRLDGGAGTVTRSASKLALRRVDQDTFLGEHSGEAAADFFHGVLVGRRPRLDGNAGALTRGGEVAADFFRMPRPNHTDSE